MHRVEKFGNPGASVLLRQRREQTSDRQAKANNGQSEGCLGPHEFHIFVHGKKRYSIIGQRVIQGWESSKPWAGTRSSANLLSRDGNQAAHGQREPRGRV